MASFAPPTVRPLPNTARPSITTTVCNRLVETSASSIPIPTPSPTPRPQLSHLPRTSHAIPPAPPISPVKPTVVWFRDDLRVHDHPALHAAVSNSHTVAALLLVPPKPTRFWCDAARDLRDALRRRGAELHVRPISDRPIADGAAIAVKSFVEDVGAGALHFHTGVTREARAEQAAVGRVLAENGVKVESFWTGALHTPQQLPFEVESMPEDCDKFNALMRDVAVGEPLAAAESIVGMSGIEAGDIPVGEGVIGEGVTGGGERVGLARVRDYVEGRSLVEMNGGSVGVIDTKFGRLGPFLSMGCVSPRRLWHEVMDRVSERSVRRWCAEFELSLRDFVMFLTMKRGVHPV